MSLRGAFLTRFTRPDSGDGDAWAVFDRVANFDGEPEVPGDPDAYQLAAEPTTPAPGGDDDDDNPLGIVSGEVSLSVVADLRGERTLSVSGDGRTLFQQLAVRFSWDCTDTVPNIRWLPTPLVYPEWPCDDIRVDETSIGWLDEDVPTLEGEYDAGSNTITLVHPDPDPEAPETPVLKLRLPNEQEGGLYPHMSPWLYQARVGYDPPLRYVERLHPLTITVGRPLPYDLRPRNTFYPEDEAPEGEEDWNPRLPVRLEIEGATVTDAIQHADVWTLSLLAADEEFNQSSSRLIAPGMLELSEETLQTWLDAVGPLEFSGAPEKEYPVDFVIGRSWGSWEIPAWHDCAASGESLDARRVPQKVYFNRFRPGDPMQWHAKRNRRVANLRLYEALDWVLIRWTFFSQDDYFILRTRSGVIYPPEDPIAYNGWPDPPSGYLDHCFFAAFFTPEPIARTADVLINVAVLRQLIRNRADKNDLESYMDIDLRAAWGNQGFNGPDVPGGGSVQIHVYGYGPGPIVRHELDVPDGAQAWSDLEQFAPSDDRDPLVTHQTKIVQVSTRLDDSYTNHERVGILRIMGSRIDWV